MRTPDQFYNDARTKHPSGKRLYACKLCFEKKNASPKGVFTPIPPSGLKAFANWLIGKACKWP